MADAVGLVRFAMAHQTLQGPVNAVAPEAVTQASFARAGARCALPGLYLAGGGVHPGPGVPMAALSGQRLEMGADALRR